MVECTEQMSSDNLPYYPSDNQHSLDVSYWREGGHQRDTTGITVRMQAELTILMNIFIEHLYSSRMVA